MTVSTTKRVNLELCSNDSHCRREFKRLQESMAPYMEQVRQVIDDASFVDLCAENDVFLQVDGSTLDYVVAVGPRHSQHKTLRLQGFSEQSNLECIGNVVTTIFMEGAVKITTQVPYGHSLNALVAAGFKVVGELSHELLTDGTTGSILILEMLHPRLLTATKPLEDESQDEAPLPQPEPQPALKVVRLGGDNVEPQSPAVVPATLNQAPFEQKQGRQQLPGGLGYDEITFTRG